MPGWVLLVFTAGPLMASAATINTSGSKKPYGQCLAIAKSMAEQSSWCDKPPLYGHPSKSTLKYGRQTVFSGPVGKQKGWCGKILRGSNTTAAVAISTKYLPLHGISPQSHYCGQCMCIRIVGTDKTSNAYPPSSARSYFGTIIKGQVADMCSECDDDHVDILADRPYTYAPVDKWNPLAAYYNKIRGARAMPTKMAYDVGVWTVEWNFVSCSANCHNYFI